MDVINDQEKWKLVRSDKRRLIYFDILIEVIKFLKRLELAKVEPECYELSRAVRYNPAHIALRPRTLDQLQISDLQSQLCCSRFVGEPPVLINLPLPTIPPSSDVLGLTKISWVSDVDYPARLKEDLEKFFNNIAHFLTGHALCFVRRTGWDRRSWDRANFLKLISLFHHFDVINLEQVETFGPALLELLPIRRTKRLRLHRSLQLTAMHCVNWIHWREEGVAEQSHRELTISLRYYDDCDFFEDLIDLLLHDFSSSQYPQSDAKSYTILVESEPYSNFMTAHFSKAILPLLLENDETKETFTLDSYPIDDFQFIIRRCARGAEMQEPMPFRPSDYHGKVFTIWGIWH